MKTTLTPAGRAVLQSLVDAGGRRREGWVDSRPLNRLEDQGFVSSDITTAPLRAGGARDQGWIVITEAGRAALATP